MSFRSAEVLDTHPELRALGRRMRVKWIAQRAARGPCVRGLIWMSFVSGGPYALQHDDIGIRHGRRAID